MTFGIANPVSRLEIRQYLSQALRYHANTIKSHDSEGDFFKNNGARDITIPGRLGEECHPNYRSNETWKI